MDRKPYLQLRGVSKKFGQFSALKDIALTVARGEFVCLLGPSGCGNTTVLRVIAGLETQDSGTIIQDGTDVSRFPPSRRNFGIVFQSYALFPNLTVAENVAYGLQNRRLPRTQVATRVQRMLELVDLTGLDQRYPAQISGGQQQRVALARALAIWPGLLLLDEPLSALDARVRANLRLQVSQLQRKLGVTTIMVTHDQEEALTMADRIVVMDHGQIIQVGTPDDIYRAPVNPFVADFVGLMNFIPATVVRNGHPAATARYGDTLLSVESGLEAMPPGSDVTLAIRPEELSVAGPDCSSGNTLSGWVEEVEFAGAFTRLHLRLDAGATTCNAPVHIKTYVTSDGTDRPPAVGSLMPVHLPANRLRVFPSQAVSLTSSNFSSRLL